jgi:CRISP-associated protein Cas1
VRWKGTSRKPIPDEWHLIGARRSPLSKQNEYAVHPVNAMLNYAYTMLENEVRIAVVAEGLDPTIGYLHAAKGDQHALVFDLMEPLRPVVDRMVLGLVREYVFTPGDFTITGKGVCRLNPQMASILVAKVEIAGAVEQLVQKFISSTKARP